MSFPLEERRALLACKGVGAAVVNANPFTRGHRYLVEEARKRCGLLYLVVVETDRSLFPFADRIELVRANTRDLPGVRVVRSGDYAVSAATFPTYFLRDPAEAAMALGIAQETIPVPHP